MKATRKGVINLLHFVEKYGRNFSHAANINEGEVKLCQAMSYYHKNKDTVSLKQTITRSL